MAYKNSKLYKCIWSALIVLIGLIIYSFIIEPNMISVNTVFVANDNLHGLLHNKKVVHVSDLHITSIGYREQKFVKMINQINPDLLFITGDFLTDGEDESSCIEVLRQIEKPQYGIWVVLGNTDRNKGEGLNENINRFIRKLKDLEIVVLENNYEQLVLDDNGGHLFIAGIEGPHLSRSVLNRLLRDIPDNATTVLLSHYPDILDNDTDALVINLEEEEGRGVSGWGWQNNAFFEHDPGIVRFVKDGRHSMRVQRREDGVAIEQILLVPDTGSKSFLKDIARNPAGMNSEMNIHSKEMVIIKTADIPESNIFGSWKKVKDPDLGHESVIKDMPDLEIKHDAPLLEPEDYFEVEFYARGAVDYHVWVRMKAGDDSITSDSIYMQFSDSIDEEGLPVYRTGELSVRNNLTKIDLILAGHTHGGQVRFPFFGSLDFIPDHKIKYDMGLFESGGTRMYVNRGIGTTLFPIRFLCPPEITIYNFTKVKEITKEGNREGSTSGTAKKPSE